MYAHTCFNNKSQFGYSNTQLKSGICKYFRRGENEKLRWCIFELAEFINCKTGEGSKSIISNLISRLKILIMEDLSITSVDVACYCIERLNEYEKDRTNLHPLFLFWKAITMGQKSRICSYVNNWWRFNSNEYDTSNIKLDKILKYKKKEDSDELLILGELLIKSIESKDEMIIDIFNKLYSFKGKCGRRMNRRDGVYLYWEVLKSYFNSTQQQVIYNFALEMFKRNSLKERPYFGIWLGIMLWKTDELDFKKTLDIENLPISVENYHNNHKLQLDDYVINDFHVNRKFGLTKFAKEGAYVKDEDLTLLGSKAKLYKEFYISQKENTNNHSKNTSFNDKSTDKSSDNSSDKFTDKSSDKSSDKSTDKSSDKSIDINSVYISKKELSSYEKRLEFIDFNEFTVKKVIQEGVCGLKVCCVHVVYKGQYYILKEMRESFNYGRDYMFLDCIKHLFNIRPIGMKRIISNQKLFRKDLSIHSFVNNWKFGEERCIYCMMNYFPNIGDLGKVQKSDNILINKKIVKELYKIRIFDGLFRSSDNILRNILVGKDKTTLLSIDEGDIFGKRKQIFNKSDWCKKEKNKYQDIILDILNEMVENIDEKTSYIKKHMKIFGFLHYYNEFYTRFTNLHDIVLKELN